MRFILQQKTEGAKSIFCTLGIYLLICVNPWLSSYCVPLASSGQAESIDNLLLTIYYWWLRSFDSAFGLAQDDKNGAGGGGY